VTDRLTFVMIADLPADGVAAFAEYERRVLPLLRRYDGRLERRLRSADSRVEVHVISFGSRSDYEAFVADPERTGHRPLLDGIHIGQRLVEVVDITGDEAEPPDPENVTEHRFAHHRAVDRVHFTARPG
jgi:hypothetical protein